ncbi:hypothetical protein TREAZ_2684 [Leadbettera azotonutricia ZAS-9]|uniref:Uncharacterized protein n=1 Tax=Leadbettera azotonutricia (strain ATCC BAA-888 / DSM 13862 / ZAS-9) TaxID=545695 RepID=F5YDT0_LEAAZ|nr:hypothetical protein TREAZ_2684 [Leadbettera azotonutricia ZAS-9]
MPLELISTCITTVYHKNEPGAKGGREALPNHPIQSIQAMIQVDGNIEPGKHGGKFAGQKALA